MQRPLHAHPSVFLLPCPASTGRHVVGLWGVHTDMVSSNLLVLGQQIPENRDACSIPLAMADITSRSQCSSQSPC